MAKPHVAALDGIRGIAILAVLFGHAVIFQAEPLFEVTRRSRLLFDVMAAGWSGVDLFFVLSGFLITGILLDTRNALQRGRSFYMRRTLRIFPIYYATLAIIFTVAAWSRWMNSWLDPHWYDRASYVVYLQNWMPLWSGGAVRAGVLAHFWSLAVEEQFYLVWPLLVWSFPNRTVLKLCILGGAGAFLLRTVLVLTVGPQLWVNLFTVTRGEGLLVGSAFAVLAARATRVSVRTLVVVGAAGAILLAVIAVVDGHEFVDTGSGPLAYTIGVSGFTLLSGALIASTAYRVPVLTGAFSMPWLRSLGKYSYGMYVYHIPIYLVANQVILRRLGLRYPLGTLQALVYLVGIIGFTYGFARLSYHAFEKRFLNLKRYYEPIRVG